MQAKQQDCKEQAKIIKKMQVQKEVINSNRTWVECLCCFGHRRDGNKRPNDFQRDENSAVNNTSDCYINNGVEF